jgi:hypothetical protein
MTPEQIENWFTHHPPADLATINRYHAIREVGRAMALTILEQTPSGADQAAAIRKVREAVMTANAAIACEAVTPADLDAAIARRRDELAVLERAKEIVLRG